LAVDGESISAGWKLGEADGGMSSGWWSNFVSFHHWEAGWLESVNVSESGGGVSTVWRRPLELGEANCGVGLGWWSNLVLLHHWEAGWVNSINISES